MEIGGATSRISELRNRAPNGLRRLGGPASVVRHRKLRYSTRSAEAIAYGSRDPVSCARGERDLADRRQSERGKIGCWSSWIYRERTRGGTFDVESGEGRGSARRRGGPWARGGHVAQRRRGRTGPLRERPERSRHHDPRPGAAGQRRVGDVLRRRGLRPAQHGTRRRVGAGTARGPTRCARRAEAHRADPQGRHHAHRRRARPLPGGLRHPQQPRHRPLPRLPGDARQRARSTSPTATSASCPGTARTCSTSSGSYRPSTRASRCPTGASTVPRRPCSIGGSWALPRQRPGVFRPGASAGVVGGGGHPGHHATAEVRARQTSRPPHGDPDAGARRS